MENKNKYCIFEGTNEFWFQKLNGSLEGKAKLIYLDPPYNTRRNRGARKSYNDKHNDWRETIKEVLIKARFYLHKDGFLAISINQTELFNLKTLLDEIFDHNGECFVGLFPVKIRHRDRQLMIGATFHNVYEYLLIYRKNKESRFNTKFKKQNINDYIYTPHILDKNPKIMLVNGKKIEIYNQGQYEILKKNPDKNNFRKYLIAGKIATANWSGEFYEKHLKSIGNNKLIKVYGLENQGNGFRWFETSDGKRKSGIYFQSFKAGGRIVQLSNDEFDFTDGATYVYKEGGEGIDFKDSKKPEAMIRRLIEVTTEENDFIMDLFGGSGTTIATAVKMNRSCYTIEKEPENVKIIEKRLQNLKRGLDQGGVPYKFDYTKNHNFNING
jgi:adenine-specific DNA-methyltransferase